MHLEASVCLFVCLCVYQDHYQSKDLVLSPCNYCHHP